MSVKLDFKNVKGLMIGGEWIHVNKGTLEYVEVMSPHSLSVLGAESMDLTFIESTTGYRMFVTTAQVQVATY